MAKHNLYAAGRLARTAPHRIVSHTRMEHSGDHTEIAVQRSSRLVCSWRLLLAFIGSSGLLMVYNQRAAMSIAIVCMVNQTALQSNGDNHENATIAPTNDSSSHTCSANLSHSTRQQDGPFIWEKTTQGHILGAYFYGYVASQIPAGILAERYGNKIVTVIFVTITIASTLLSPIAAEISYICLIILRILVGIGSGAMLPVFHSFWAKWAPPYERSKLTGITYTGMTMGNVIGFPISGMLCQHGFAGGWPSIFYVFGVASAVWIILWIVLASDTPSSHRRISEAEKSYIVNQLRGQTSAYIKKEKISVPWFDIFTSMPVWAIIVANFTFDWGLIILITSIPTYMYEVLRFDMKSNGFYSALPFISMWISTFINPIIADKLLSTKLLDMTQTRKLFTCVGLFGSAAFVLGVSFLSCSQSLWAVGLLTTGTAIGGASYSGFLVNHIDIAPKYAGTLLGLSNSIAATSGFISPPITAALTVNQTMEEWQRVFFVAAGVYIFGAIFYAIFASGNLQAWAKETVELDEIEMQGLNEKPVI